MFKELWNGRVAWPIAFNELWNGVAGDRWPWTILDYFNQSVKVWGRG